MGRKKYVLRDEDFDDALWWIDEHTSFRPHIDDADRLNTWCEHYLNNEQWYRMKAYLRTRRRVDRGLKRVDLSPAAHAVVKQQSERFGLTLSETVELACVL